MADSFTSRFSDLLDGLLRHEQEERRRSAENEERWKRAVQQFRRLTAEEIRPVLEQVQEPLRARGFHPFIGDNTRFGMSCWLDIETGEDPAAGLAFRLDAERQRVEAILQRPTGNSRLDERPLEEVEAGWVEGVLLDFLRELYGA